MDDLKKGLVIETVMSTEDVDSAKERLVIAGADITPLKQGNGFVNSDHDKSFSKLTGRILDAEKIFKAEDCKTPYQHRKWSELKRPFIWGRLELWDGYGHAEADSIASIYRFYQAKGEEPPIKTSVEGKRIEKAPDGRLTKTLIKGVALTVVPCNGTTHTQVTDIIKSHGANPDTLIKSQPGSDFIEVVDSNPIERVTELLSVAANLLEAAAKMKKSKSRSRKV
jgi:hypothetical protein